MKLGDFGLSKIMSSHDFASTYVGTPFYMSPEICASERYTLFSDIWGLGCIIYELCTKEPPFNARSHLELIQKIKSGKFAPLPSFYSQELQNVISMCLKVNPNHRPDTAHLLNLPIVKLMRKAQEVTRIGQKAVLEKEQALKMLEETKIKLAETERKTIEMHDTVDASLRREWEVKARLEIDRQVKTEIEALRDTFEIEVNKRVVAELERRLLSIGQNGQSIDELSSQSDKNTTQDSSSSPRSSTPELKEHISIPTVSQSTAASANDDFPSSTDISSLSLESPLESKASSAATSNRTNLDAAKPAKRSGRTPFTRARTMFAAPSEVNTIPSPTDIEMVDPSPMSIDRLGLSPRRNGAGYMLQAPDPPRARGNIFAAVSRRLDPISATSDDEDSDGNVSPTPANTSRTSTSAHSSVNEDVSDDDQDNIDDVPTPSRPGPTTNLARAHLKSALPPFNASSGDPFKPAARPRPGISRQKTMPVPQRNNTAGVRPSIFEPTSRPTDTRPAPAIPVVATSPSRPKSSNGNNAAAVAENGSPTRHGNATSSQQQTQQQQQQQQPKKNVDEELLKRMHQKKLRGRTLVELAQERVGPMGKAMSSPAKDREMERVREVGVREDGRPGVGLIEREKPSFVAVWDPERDEMPSPFLVRGQKAVIAGSGGRAAWR